MNIHHFPDEELRTLASLAIDLDTDKLYFEVVKTIAPKANYWSFDCRFAVSKDEINTYYDSFNLNCGADNDPSTYQMSWNTMADGRFLRRPITSPLLVVHYFEEMCKKLQTSITKDN